MITFIEHDNYGYSVTTRDKWLAVGSPSFIAYPPVTSSIPTSGSVDVFLYDKRTDRHNLEDTLYRQTLPEEEILLATEADDILHTELTGSVPITADLDIAIDYGLYLTASWNDYGRSVDLHKEWLGVGYTRNFMKFDFVSGSIELSGSGGVDIYDLGVYDPDNITIRDTISFDTSFTASGDYYYSVRVPPGYSAINLEFTTNSINWATLQTLSTNYSEGGLYIFRFPSAPSASYAGFRVTENYDNDPYVMTIRNPHPTVTQSFGFSLSINDDWVAVGSPQYSASRGGVYLFRKYGGPSYENLSWSFHSVITASDARIGDQFGWSLELNDSPGFVGYATGSVAYSQSLVVGTNKSSGSKVYYFEISGSGGLSGSIESASWNQRQTFTPSYNAIPLTYYPDLNPLISESVTVASGGAVTVNPREDRFGYDVSIYGNTIVVGAPYDRYYYEYTQSAVYQQGAFYIFERCPTAENGWYLKLKSNGEEKSLKNHRLGYAVDVYEQNLVVGSPKVTAAAYSIYNSASGASNMSACYTQGSLYQAHFCRTEDEFQIHGQYAYLSYNTNSTNWEYNNIYQIKKDYLEPYRNFGFAVDISDRFSVVGAPMNMSGSRRTIDINYTGSLTDIDPIAGQAYIYNLNNYRSQFHIGNVFYRNGKIVLITSGSQFDSLFLNTVSDKDYQYDLFFDNKQTVHEKQVICSVDPGEFNVSTNPTSLQITHSLFDLNKNGRLDFQDIDVLLMYMNFKRTEDTGNQTTDWSSSLLTEPDEISWHNFLKTSGSFYGTDTLYSSSFANLNTTTMYQELDFNQDHLIDSNDQNILWKYFARRLTQKNFDKYITVNSERRLYGEIFDHLNTRTLRDVSPPIKSEFFDYERLSKNDQTGSYLAPYVTSIGLYQQGELVAVAKLGNPIKLLPDYPYNFVVKMDF